MVGVHHLRCTESSSKWRIDLTLNPVWESDPAYGMVSFSRCSGNPGTLFGSPLTNHEHFVRLSIGRGQSTFDLGSQRFYRPHDGELIEVLLSAAQFAELITTMNVGLGAPCTISRLNGKQVPRPAPSEVHETTKVHNEFRATVQKMVAKLNEQEAALNEILEKKALTKQDRNTLSRVISEARSTYEDLAPFMLEMFQESADKVVSHAKAEVDAVMTHSVMVAGLASLNATKVLEGEAK